MGLGDWVIIVSCRGLSGLGVYMLHRLKHPRAFKRIPREIQAEIDVTPEWWDAQFRKLQGLPTPQETIYGDFFDAGRRQVSKRLRKGISPSV